MKEIFTLVRVLLKRQRMLQREERLTGRLISALAKFERANRGHQHMLSEERGEESPSAEAVSQQKAVSESSWEVMRELFAENAHLIECPDHVSAGILKSLFSVETELIGHAGLSELSSRLNAFSRVNVSRGLDFRWQYPFFNTEGDLVVYLMFPIVPRSKELTSKTWSFSKPAANSLREWHICIERVMREMRETILKHESWAELSDTRKKSALFYAVQKDIEEALRGYSSVERIKIAEMWGDLKPRVM